MEAIPISIADTDILYKYSTKVGTAGNQNTGNADGSLGKYISTTEIVTATLHNLFDAISGDENAASDVEYRGYFAHNNHATLTWLAPVVWISSETAGGATAAISVDTTTASALAASSAQGKEIADESTAPATQTFTAPTTKGTGLALGDLAAGNVRQIWVRRSATNSAALANDGFVCRVEGDSL